jgi:hypothetical protein
MRESDKDDMTLFILVAVVSGLFIILSYVAGNSDGRRSIRREACEHKAGRYVADEYGNSTFVWNSDNPEKESVKERRKE